MAQLFDNIDTESATLILRLQREDAEQLASSSKGKQREDEVADAEMALQMCLQELSQFESFYTDRQMARSLARAVITDGRLIAETIRSEDQIQRDQALALALERATDAGEDRDPDPLGAGASEDDSDDDTMARNEARFLAEALGAVQATAGHSRGQSRQAESSKRAASRENNNDSDCMTCVPCVACADEKPWYDIIRAPCGDHYCGECLSKLFTSSMTDESLYPPRCCRQPIPLKEAKKVLTSGVATAFAEKSIELDTKNRTYCHAPSCFKFIPPADIQDDIGTCPNCGRRTCVTCKSVEHYGDCPEDSSLQQLLQTADSEGWQRCYSCNRVVELNTGCNHMICVCNSQFCYVCASPWKECDCPQWHEDRLLQRATQIANRVNDPRRRLYQPPRGVVPSSSRTQANAAVELDNEPILPPLQEDVDEVEIWRRTQLGDDLQGLDVDDEELSWEELAHSYRLALESVPDTQNGTVEDTHNTTGNRRGSTTAPVNLFGAVPAVPAQDHDDAAFSAPSSPSPRSTVAVVGQALPYQPAASADDARNVDRVIPVPPRLTSPSQTVQSEISPHILAIMRDLRNNHHCEHARWRWVKGPHRCEECTTRLPQYIFECRSCRIQACWQCRKNRL